MKPVTVATLLLLIASTASAQQFDRNILLEEFSTAPCGFCPDGDLVAEQLVRDHPTVIWVTHHAGFGVDSLTVPESVVIANAFTNFAPGACIDRGDYPIPIYTQPNYIAVSRQRWDSVVTAHLGDAVVLDLDIANFYDGDARFFSCTVSTTFRFAPLAGDYRLNLYLVEDSASGVGKGFDQTNYYDGTVGHPYYRAGDPIVGYVHRRVIRAIPGGPWGVEGVFPASPDIGYPYEYTFHDIAIPERWNPAALDVVAFVSRYDSDPKKRQVLYADSRRMLDGPAAVDRSAAAVLPGTVEIYPHPVRDRAALRVALPDGVPGELTVFDRLGRSAGSFRLPGGVRTIELRTTAYPAGYYLARVVTRDGGTFSRGFVVAR
jgi:hypothetical protein